ncbi:hypothetical protein VTL71DRAFT_7850 [Oculimacula yallundae]|uniref:Nicotinamide-nucleotide adenylyltransferase n=1 Tax=Oculimacula yallundae TaxID=86028 RepID=A0ABR4CWV3_9HELO
MASDPQTQPASAQALQNYTFPRDRLRLTQTDGSRIPLVLIACGSFSPITYLHLRMFEMGADYARFESDFEVMGGYFSPVSDAYKKAGLASAHHRLRMCELGAEQSSWLMVDPWEAVQTKYVPTAQVLDHFEHEINEVLGGAEKPDGTRVKCRILLLAGADLISTMSTPGVWSDKDLDHILGRYGAFVVERTGTDMDEALQNLQPWKDNLYVISQLIQNDISSTKIRLFLRREMSVQYLIPAPVIEYIEAHGLYEEDADSKAKAKAKEDVSEGAGSSTSYTDSKMNGH